MTSSWAKTSPRPAAANLVKNWSVSLQIGFYGLIELTLFIINLIFNLAKQFD
jgi:hypothetical protein